MTDEQLTLGDDRRPVDAEPAGDLWPGAPKCEYREDGNRCRNYAVVGVRFVGETDPTPLCARHARGAWLRAAGV